ncbi:MAG: 50S ribosomal protein L16 [Candidatus Spechtbacteria bacterium]|nr:50S ribosomal protein L16 [Candidatus Spechtbacteria bacterium]
MLVPKKVKHRKWTKGHHRTAIDSRGTTLSFGSYGLQVKEGHGRVTSRQIEAVRRVFTRAMKKGGKVWIRIFPDRPITKKGVEVPMGGGKGSVEHYVADVGPGRILFEIDGITPDVAKETMRLAGFKLSVRTRMITRE